MALWIGGFGRFAGAAPAAVVALVAALGLGVTSPASAQVNSSDQVIGGDGLTVRAIQSDTDIRFVPPLDGNMFTHEWFHSEVAGYSVTGPKAADWHGHISIGYLVGYPASFTGRLIFEWHTPSLAFAICPQCGPIIGDLIPQAGVDIGVGNGPGVVSVTTAQGDVQGAGGSVRVANLHGTVTGVVGQLNIRPFVTIVGPHGDSITTYGPVWSN